MDNSNFENSPLNEKAHWKIKLPMWITVSRMLFVPFIVFCLFFNNLQSNIVAALLFMLASLTDYWDGYFARKYNAVSNFGKFMDPIADKILVTSILVMLSYLQKIDPIMVIVILARDNFIGGLRSVAAADSIIIDAKPSGKWKTALQMIAIPAVMIDEKWLGLPFDKIGYFVLWISVVLAVSSGMEYYWGYLKEIRSRKKQQK